MNRAPHVLFSRIDHRNSRYAGCECQCCTPTMTIPDLDTRFALPIICPTTGERVSAETLYNRCCADLGYVVRDNIGDLIFDNFDYSTDETVCATDASNEAIHDAVYAWADGVRKQIGRVPTPPTTFTNYRFLRKFMVSTARGPQSIIQHWDNSQRWDALCGDVRIDRTEKGFLVHHRHDGLGAFHVLHGFNVPPQGHRKAHRSFIPALLHAAALIRAYEAARS